MFNSRLKKRVEELEKQVKDFKNLLIVLTTHTKDLKKDAKSFKRRVEGKGGNSYKDYQTVHKYVKEVTDSEELMAYKRILRTLEIRRGE